MGVPGFFSWMRKISRNSSVVFSAPRNDPDKHQKATCVDGLLIDVNAALYTIIREWPSETEDEFLNSMVEYIKWVMLHFPPKSLMYLALDGVAPTAKMVTQRARRYEPVVTTNTSIKNVEFISSNSPNKRKSAGTGSMYEAKPKKRKTSPEPEQMPDWWNRCAFSPGTELMDRVADKLRILATELALQNPLAIFLSSTNVPGEGEQKIFDYIRLRKLNDNLKFAVVGSDADILIMGIAAIRTYRNKRLQILCVRDQMNKPKVVDGDPLSKRRGFMYVKMDLVRDGILNAIRADDDGVVFYKSGIPTFTPKRLGDDQIITDFIALSCMVGNDFLPHIPSMSAYTNSLDKILDAYRTQLYRNSIPLVRRDERGYFCVYVQSLKILLQHLVKTEIDDAIALDKQSVETDTITPPSEPNWSERYNNDRFGDEIEEACHCYVAGIEWTVHYYTNYGCPDLHWKYKWPHAPTLSAILYYLDTKPVPMWNGTHQEYPTTQRQLMNIIPPEAAHLVPEQWRWLLVDKKSPFHDIINACKHGKNDARYKIKDFQASYIIPTFDPSVMDDLLDERVLNEDESRRNQTLLVEIFHNRQL